jgi:hypothetical protein
MVRVNAHKIFLKFLYRMATAAGALSNALGERAAIAHWLLDVTSNVFVSWPALEWFAYALEFLNESRWPPNCDD